MIGVFFTLRYLIRNRENRNWFTAIKYGQPLFLYKLLMFMAGVITLDLGWSVLSFIALVTYYLFLRKYLKIKPLEYLLLVWLPANTFDYIIFALLSIILGASLMFMKVTNVSKASLVLQTTASIMFPTPFILPPQAPFSPSIPVIEIPGESKMGVPGAPPFDKAGSPSTTLRADSQNYPASTIAPHYPASTSSTIPSGQIIDPWGVGVLKIYCNSSNPVFRNPVTGQYRNLLTLGLDSFPSTQKNNGQDTENNPNFNKYPHVMSESLRINSSKISCKSGEDKMRIEPQAVVYEVRTGYIPMTEIAKKQDYSGADNKNTVSSKGLVDKRYAGKMLFFGEEGQVRLITSDTIVLSTSWLLTDELASNRYTETLNGHKMKIDSLLHSKESTISGVILDVIQPDGTVHQVLINGSDIGNIGDISVRIIQAKETAGISTASAIIYDLNSEVILHDGDGINSAPGTTPAWVVRFNKLTGENPDGLEGRTAEYGGIMDYDGIRPEDALLESITIANNQEIILEKGQAISLPKNLKVYYSQ